jgi:hypothetical protein
VGTDPVKFTQVKVAEQKILQEEENRRLEIVVEDHESRLTIGSGKSCEGVNLQATKEAGHRISAFGVW